MFEFTKLPGIQDHVYYLSNPIMQNRLYLTFALKKRFFDYCDNDDVHGLAYDLLISGVIVVFAIVVIMKAEEV